MKCTKTIQYIPDQKQSIETTLKTVYNKNTI